MKRCPQCSRTYTDETLNFCLDDGEWLLADDEPATVIVSEPAVVATGSQGSESPTKYQIHTTDKTSILPTDAIATNQTSFVRKRSFWLAAGVIALIIVVGVFGYRYLRQTAGDQINSIAVMPFVNEN